MATYKFRLELDTTDPDAYDTISALLVELRERFDTGRHPLVPRYEIRLPNRPQKRRMTKRFDILFGIAIAAATAGILALLKAPAETGLLAILLGALAAWNPGPWQWPPRGGWRN